MGRLKKKLRYLAWKIIFIRFFFRNYFYDALRFYKYSGLIINNSEKHLYQISYYYHVLEKGFSYTNMRFEFGKDKVEKLLMHLKSYNSLKADLNNTQYQSGLLVLKKYADLHKSRTDIAESTKKLLMRIDEFLKPKQDTINSEFLVDGGVKRINKQEYIDQGNRPFNELVKYRSSIRTFSNEEVSIKAINEAISLATHSPSVCNRQPIKAYVLTETDQIQAVLKIQKGTVGFSQEINKLLIVAADLNAFYSINERNQGYLDGGLFTMNLMYAFHQMGIGTCPLHWSVNKDRDKLLRKTVPIMKNHTVLVMIGLGQLQEEFKVPVSQRRALSEVIYQL